jgi:nucleotide-binding universal stress UspA family protein
VENADRREGGVVIRRDGAVSGVDTILVPLDGSRFSKRALPVAFELARRLGAQLHLLSAVPTEDESRQP